ncbi:hypothetical protein BDV18DRAFT_138263 [Aspergillus unguis]
MSDIEDRSAIPRFVVVALLPLVCITMALRMYLRAWVAKALGWDDGLMIAALCCFVVHSACIIVSSYNGLGADPRVIPPDQSVYSVKILWAGQLAYGLSTCTCKAAVCLFMLRIAVKPLHRLLVQGVIVYTILLGLLVTLMELVHCRPLSYKWARLAEDSTAKGTCLTKLQNQAISYAASCSLLVIDILLGIVIPIVIVWSLQMRRASKFAVLGILGLTVFCVPLTIFATATIITRIPYMSDYGKVDGVQFSIDITVWTYVELSLSIMTGNLATLGPLLRIWFGISSERPTPATITPLPGQHRQRCRGRRRGILDLSYPLSTFAESVHGVFRRGRLSATTGTQSESWRHQQRHSAMTSQEQLTFQSTVSATVSASASASSNREFELKPGAEGQGLGILRTMELEVVRLEEKDIEEARHQHC